MDIIQSHAFKLTPKHPKWDIDKLSSMHGDMDRLSVDLEEFGIKKPKQTVFKENVGGNLCVLDWIGNDSCVKLIRERRVNYICDEVVRFDAPNLIELGRRNGTDKILKNYDAVILCTGYSHGLQDIFDKKLFEKYFEESKIGKRYGIVPKTNGYNQCREDKTLYFLGLLGDYSVIGGLANGYWGWEVARNIAKDEGVYDKRKEPSTWNGYTFKMMSLFVVSVGSLLGVASYFGFKAYEKYYCNDNNDSQMRK